MKIFCMIVMVFLIIPFSYGQNDTTITNTMTLSPGFDYISLKDRTFSPIVLKGVVPKFSLKFSQNRRNNTVWNTSVTVSSGTINHNNSYFPSRYTSAQLAINYLSRIVSTTKSKVYLGGQFRSNVDLLDYNGFKSGGWFTAQHLDPVLIYNYKISENQKFTGQFAYPVLNLVSRPGYAGVDEFVVSNSDDIPNILYSGMQIQSVNKIVNPKLYGEYSYRSKNYVFSISVNYSYLHVNSIRKYYKNELGIRMGFTLQIGNKNEQ